MKTAILIANGVKQIMFTPENDAEKQALNIISTEDDIHTVIKRGQFADTDEVFGVDVQFCEGGFLRAYKSEKSVMFVLTPKEKKKELDTYSGDQLDDIPFGLYEIFWKSGGSSLASVGNMYDGIRWIAPINWTGKRSVTGKMSKHKKDIERMVLIRKPEK